MPHFPFTEIQLDIDFNFAVYDYIKRLEKKQLKIWKKNQASIKCWSKITLVEYQNQLISDMKDRFYVNY